KENMFRCSSSSLLVGHNVTFFIDYNTQPGENLYIVGSQSYLGEWDVSRAKRMTWNTGNVWDVKIGFSMDVSVQYKYFVMNEHTKQCRWEDIDNRKIMIDTNEMLVQDHWNVIRKLSDPPLPDGSSPQPRQHQQSQDSTKKEQEQTQKTTSPTKPTPTITWTPTNTHPPRSNPNRAMLPTSPSAGVVTSCSVLAAMSQPSLSKESTVGQPLMNKASLLE
ncbi:hypothetical protein SAMD00019534_084050, partial [Acytostelium subglobosum LB1]|uniref:hypothetical protein n=1 Tax=Acytostelium subglobosum LB1 TaxID=1410327 RepID=UPI000644EEA6